MTNLEYLIAAEESRKQRAAKKAKPQRGNFLNKVEPPKALPGSTSTFGALLDFPKFDDTEKRRQKFGASDYGLAAAKALEEPGLANRAATGFDAQLGPSAEERDQRLRRAAKPSVDADLASAMASFDRENPNATPEQREMVKYRVQGMLAKSSPALGEAAVEFKMDVARGADPWEAAKKHAPAYFRDLQETKAGQAVLKPLREFNQKVGTIASEAVMQTAPVSILPRQQTEPFVRPAVRTATSLLNPGTYAEQVLANAHDPQAAQQMLDSYTALLDPKKPLEDKVQSAITWGLTLFGLASAPGISAGKGTRAMAEGATAKAIEILQEAPETPETAAALQKLNTVAADWDGFWNGQGKALEAPQRAPIAETPTIGQPGKELGAQAAGMRRPFSEDRAVAAFEQKVLATGKVDPDQARAVAETMRARARSHEAMTGQAVQHFWEELVPEIRTMAEAEWRQQAGATALKQEGWTPRASQMALHNGRRVRISEIRGDKARLWDQTRWIKIEELSEPPGNVKKPTSAGAWDYVQFDPSDLGRVASRKRYRIETDGNAVTAIDPETGQRTRVFKGEDNDLAGWEKVADDQGVLFQTEPPKQGEPGWSTFDIDTPERRQLREQVTQELYGTGAKSKTKTATLVIGGSGSGKSTLAEGRYVIEDNALLIDADLAKKKLPEYDEPEGASRVHLEGNAIVDDVMQAAIRNGDSVVKPMTGSDYAKTLSLIDQLKARGYAVRVVLVDLPADEAIRRIEEIRVKEEGGMPVPEKVTRESNRLARETYNKLKAEGLADEFARFDNNVPRGQRPRITEREVGPVQRLVPGTAAAREHVRGGRRAGGDVPAGSRGQDPGAAATLGQENLTGSAAKGAVEFGADGRAIITLFENADVSTIMHELAHTWRRQLAGEDMLAVRDWLGADESGRLTRAQEERFARATERYLMTGKAPSAKLQWAFDKFREWFRQIYVSVKVSKQIDVKIPREVREVFDRMFNEDLARAPRRKQLEALAKRREELAAMDPRDPRLDPFADEFDPVLADEIRDELGSQFGENMAPHQILEEIQTRLWEEQEKAASSWDAGTAAEYLSYVKGVRSDQSSPGFIRWSYDAKRGGWYPDYRQKVTDVNVSGWPEDLQRMIEAFRDEHYRDPEYRLLSEAKSRQLTGGMSRPPDGSLTVSEFAQKEGTTIGDSQHGNTFPVPLVQEFASFLESGTPMAKTLDAVIKDLDNEANYARASEEAGVAPKTEIEAVMQSARDRDYQKRMQELESQAQREKYERDQAERERQQADRIRNGEETLLERRAREAAERLAERKENTGPTKPKEVEEYVEDTETLFQEDEPLDPQTFDDVRDVAAGMLEREVADQRVYESIRARYKLTPAQAKEAMRSARKLLRILKAEEEIPKAAPRILELDEAGLGFQDISRVLSDEFPKLTKNRHKRAWAQALEGAGKPVANPAGERRYTFIKSEIDRATVRIQDMEASGKPFFEISEMLTDEYPAIPKAYHEEAFAKAMANKEDWVVTRIDDKGHIKVFMGGKSVTVPLATVADIEQWASVNWKGFKTESRLVDQMSGRNQQLRSWLIENREKAVTAMVRERGTWRATLLEEPTIAWLKKDKKASELVQKFGEGVIGLDELKLQRPDDWKRVIEADTWFRMKYEELLERANESLKKLGQKPIPYRKNYYTHFQERGNLWQRLMGDEAHRGGIMTEILDVGTARTSQGKRNSPWNPFAQKRLKKEADVYDALGAFEAYLDPTLAQIHLTKPAMRRRVLARVLEEKAQQLKEQSTDGQSFENAAEAANDFAYILNSQADALVGQRGAFDKAVDNQAAMAKPVGPVAVKALQWLARRAAASKIVGSIRTAVMQTSGLALAVPELGHTNLAIGAIEQVRSMFASHEGGNLKGLKSDPVLAKSDFLTRRYAETGPVRETLARKMVELAAVPMEFIEQNVAETIWRAAYDRARLQSDGAMGSVRGGLGLSEDAAVAYADRIAERILAGRAVGERPMMFNSQAGKILYQFQLEQGNFLQYLGDDFWRDNGRRLGKGEATWKAAKLMGALYVLNTVYEQLFGANPLPDPIRTAQDEYEILTAEIDPLEKAQRAIGRLGGEVLSAAPGGSTAAAIIPEYDILGTGINRRELLGDTEAGTFAGGVPAIDTFKRLLSDEFATVIVRDLLLPGGGTQVQRTIRGIDAITEGALSKPVSKRQAWWEEQVYELVRSGAYDTKPVEFDPTKPPKPEDLLERLARRRKFKIETPIDKARALIFGPTGTDAARQHYQKEYKKTLAPVPEEIKVRLRLPG